LKNIPSPTLCFCLLFIFPIESSAQWIKTNEGFGGVIYSLVVKDTNLFAGTRDNGVILSTNDGINWTAINKGLLDTNILTLVIKGTDIFAGTHDGGIFRSTDNGGNWNAVNIGLTCTHVYALAANESNLFAGTQPGGVFCSTDNGTNWTTVNSGLTDTIIWSLAIKGENLFVGTLDSGVFISTNNGTSWTPVNSELKNTWIKTLVVNGNNLFAGTNYSGVFVSTNNGTTWSPINAGLTDKWVNALTVSDTKLFAGTDHAGVFLSTNNGSNWIDVNSGFSGFGASSVHAFAVNGPNLFAGTYWGFVWKRPISEMITSVEQANSRLPERFILFQNYPNPFNPTTTISFSVPSKSFVSLKIFDGLGRELSILFSEELVAGTYSKEWDAGDLSSGVYFYRLQIGSLTETKKLVLLR
jgi:photosystem II stability/assembly factor-like uncharacterized protein